MLGEPFVEVHPDELARVRVILHWDRLGSHDEKGGTWMRVAQRGSPGSTTGLGLTTTRSAGRPAANSLRAAKAPGTTKRSTRSSQVPRARWWETKSAHTASNNADAAS